MTMSKAVILVCFLVLLGIPMLFRPAHDQARPPVGSSRLIIITPHNEQIRREFARAFDEWHDAQYGGRVNVIYTVPGGTSEIRKMLEAQFIAAIEAGREPGGDADLVFGGGSYEHTVLKRGVTATAPDGASQSLSISVPVDLQMDWLETTYGENVIGDAYLYDPDRYWFGTALSGFGIVFNRDMLAQINVPEPTAWHDLCHPRLRGWVSLVNPGQSGSITTAFEAILQRRGWTDGWRILRRAGANSRYFSASSLKGPIDVSQGNAAMGVCIDFYGRYQSQAVARAAGVRPGSREVRIGYVDPPGEGTIDPDPISMLRGAPNPEIARRFIEFCLSEQAQALWQFSLDDQLGDGLGPREFELRRLPILRSMYERHIDRMIDQVNPFELAAPLEHAHPHFRAFVAVLFASMVMDVHAQLVRAWEVIIAHPAYPAHAGIVTADSPEVNDPRLRRMLELFDAMPTVEGLDASAEGTRVYSFANPDDLAAVRSGWLGGGWKDAELWHKQSTPSDALRRNLTRFFRENYQAIVRMAEE
ncbi:MAG TPA: extracellular solute-binding protein [Phycisphaerales bacterium]|nr:extracellular solute-binding protein [Phycisphaerales bacterium]